ncbi:hypothetical protein HZH66_005571 [Vespula vulgaris]|uniref:Uncharacterized protein n=3 Tax=Vespula TaxID=7451 RepID=A0A834K594_VESVU|nr:hypothetical protein HZH66_005571 [Vespula vulgaris]
MQQPPRGGTWVGSSCNILKYSYFAKEQSNKFINTMKVCGPKYALCGLVLSVWGIFQLVLMGIFFYIKSVALVEDLPLEGKYFSNKEEFYTEAERGYTQNAYNCWIAACIYVLTFLFSGYQFYLNSRSSLSV